MVTIIISHFRAAAIQAVAADEQSINPEGDGIREHPAYCTGYQGVIRSPGWLVSYTMPCLLLKSLHN